MTTVVKGKPTYKDKIPVINKITIAPGEEREVTLLLKPHVGSEGRKKDGKIISFVAGLSEEMDDAVLINKFAEDDEWLKIASIVLDLDDDEGETVLNNLTIFDIVGAFKDAIPYRTQQVKRPEVEESLKKLRGGDDTEEEQN
jgi:hypothetical protein